MIRSSEVAFPTDAAARVNCGRVPSNAAAFRSLEKTCCGRGATGAAKANAPAPSTAGRWSLAILGIPLIVLSVVEAHAAFTSPQRAEASAYLPCLLALAAAGF
jgi:hypothetical protein